jgi:hypothetical protein
MSIFFGDKKESLQLAIWQARQCKNPDKKIVILEGEYFFEKPIYLLPEDSGLTIEASRNVKLFGGKQIPELYLENDKFWYAKIPSSDSGELDFRMLIVNGRYADRARYPENGYLVHETNFDVKWLSTYEGGFEREPSHEELTTLKYKPSDVPGTFVPENAEITVFHMWDESLVGVKSIDREKSEIRFSNPSGWPPGAFANDYNFEKRYVIWNTIEGMLKPGQWFLDRKNHRIVYWPLNGETIESARIVVPMSDNLIVLQGTESQPVRNITLKGFSVSATNAPLMSGAFGAKLFDGAISMRNVVNCKLLDLEVYNVGAHCIKAWGDKIKIEGCKLHHSGAGAIRIMGSEAVIRNNHIHHVGRTFPSAIALFVGATDPNVPSEWEPGQLYSDCTIEHNEIHDVPYAAICAGGKNLRILKNLIYRAMQDLYDGAGVYITFCSNALVKHNIIRDIKDAPGAGTSAYYLDELTVDALIEENIEIDVPRASHNHISSNNTFRNNFFIIRGKGRFTMERSDGYTFENNVVVAPEGYEMYDLKFCPNFRNNIIFTKGRMITKDLDKYAVVKEYDLELADGNINQDPLLVNYYDGNIMLSPDSPIHTMGIRPIDISDAGLLH